MNLGLRLHLVCAIVCSGLLCDEREFPGGALERWLVVGFQFSSG